MTSHHSNQTEQIFEVRVLSGSCGAAAGRAGGAGGVEVNPCIIFWSEVLAFMEAWENLKDLDNSKKY